MRTRQERPDCYCDWKECRGVKMCDTLICMDMMWKYKNEEQIST